MDAIYRRRGLVYGVDQHAWCLIAPHRPSCKLFYPRSGSIRGSLHVSAPRWLRSEGPGAVWHGPSCSMSLTFAGLLDRSLVNASLVWLLVTPWMVLDRLGEGLDCFVLIDASLEGSMAHWSLMVMMYVMTGSFSSKRKCSMISLPSHQSSIFSGELEMPSV